ncbi:hypothetical protein BJX96DRAFT_178833 [Aspergillus floccosus]
MASSLSHRAQVLLPDIIEDRSRSNPNRVWAICPVAQKENPGGLPSQRQFEYRTVTYGEFSNAINHVACIMKDFLGEGSCFETLAYIGPADLRYSIVTVAAIKAGYKMFLPSPRNSASTCRSLLTQLNCRVLVTTDPEPPSISSITTDYVMIKLNIPSLRDLLDDQIPRAYKCIDQSPYDPIFVLHTSGSTGDPKPVVYTHEFVSRLVLGASLGVDAGEDSTALCRLYNTGRFYCMLPPFHAAGLAFSLLLPAYFDCVPVYPLPGSPPSISSFHHAILNVDLDWALLTPNVIADLAQRPAPLKTVSTKVEYLMYIGGSVPQWAGDIVSGSTPLYQLLGSSECGLLPLTLPQGINNAECWNYLQVHPCFGAEFFPRYDKVCELGIVRQSEGECYQPVFTLFPSQSEYLTRDLFEPHPSMPNLWTYCGRTDDIIVFLNGEKTNPIAFEQQISAHPDVRHALLAGHQQEQAILLIEPESQGTFTSEQKVHIIESLWPTIEEANTHCPAHARVSKNRVLLADPPKQFVRTGKGTVQRQATWELFAADIASMALDKKETIQGPARQGTDHLDLEVVKRTISDALTDIVKRETIADDVDYFSRGLDSLHITQLWRKLQSTLPLPYLEVDDIYSNPTTTLLAERIVSTAPTESPPNDPDRERLRAIQAYLDQYSTKVDQIALDAPITDTRESLALSSRSVVVLTGSSGSIGSHLLDLLLRDPLVTHVYCLNRRNQSEATNGTQSTEPSLFDRSKVTFLHADLSCYKLGLSDAVYDKLRNSATLILHAAWPVNFNLSLKAFESSLDGVLNLIRLVVGSARRPSFFFLSSVTAVLNYPRMENAAEQVPETVIPQPLSAAASGYGESKYVAERILHYASERLHMSVGIGRIGQVTGRAQDGRGWKKKEWFPSLVISSRYLGGLPQSLGPSRLADSVESPLDWIPLDVVSKVLFELICSMEKREESNKFRLFNVAHPRPTEWKDILPTIRDAVSVGRDRPLDLLDFTEWVDRLEESASKTLCTSNQHFPTLNPAVHLIQFYRSLLKKTPVVGLKLSRSLQCSPTLRKLEGLSTESWRQWVDEWLGLGGQSQQFRASGSSE